MNICVYKQLSGIYSKMFCQFKTIGTNCDDMFVTKAWNLLQEATVLTLPLHKDVKFHPLPFPTIYGL